MKQLIAMPNRADRVERLIEQFASRYPQFHDRSLAFGACKFVSYELCKYLRHRGEPCELIHLQGYTGSTSDVLPAWTDKPQAEWSHYVLRVDTDYWDLTARQFSGKVAYPFRSNLLHLQNNWTKVESDKSLNNLANQFLPSM